MLVRATMIYNGVLHKKNKKYSKGEAKPQVLTM